MTAEFAVVLARIVMDAVRTQQISLYRQVVPYIILSVVAEQFEMNAVYVVVVILVLQEVKFPVGQVLLREIIVA